MPRDAGDIVIADGNEYLVGIVSAIFRECDYSARMAGSWWPRSMSRGKK